MVDPSINEALLQYGKWLRGTLIKFLQCIAEQERSTLKAFSKMHFDSESSSLGDDPIKGKGLTPTSFDNMVLDDGLAIPSGTDAFKQKLQDRGKSAVNDRKKDTERFRCYSADCIGRSGGVAMLWCKGLGVQLFSMSQHHIDVAVKALAKKGDPGKLQHIFFTYSGRPSLHVLFMILVSVAMILYVGIIDGDDSKARGGKYGFKFENMWALDKDCDKVIKSAWNEVNDTLNVVVVENKFASCAVALSLWNSSSLGQGVDDISRREEILQAMSEWRKTKEILYLQRSRIDFLKDGNSNTK
ncbi:hypothetical protein Cgig2_027672 [Carnegiea gigantea]|uniref:Uncharacterized protein n=1 Tax=Carnegiea gigantea TaxID=171969 RepID=A0A9Q1JQU6_9CARY|nr:hypothetical protein Cgig2_027672 [Carnegiea gigantea]